MKIYIYDPVTGEYIGSATAEKSPLEPGAWLLPAHATTIAPPAPTAQTCAVFDCAGSTWTLTPDHRGQAAWNILTGRAETIVEMGITLTDLGLTDVPPPVGPVKWDGAAWQPDAEAIKQSDNAAILAQISALDMFVPRGLEDAITAYGWDTTKLPAIQQERLARKAELRAKLQK